MASLVLLAMIPLGIVAIFRAAGEEKLLVLLTCQDPISMVR